jgi:hypothetical protein
MEIRLPTERMERVAWGVLALVVILGGLLVVGRLVTPMEAGRAVLLTPDRWQAGKLARQARQETVQLYRDTQALLTLLAEPTPDPVAAMLLAQGIYARHRSGTSATGVARQALITAAEATASAAAGSRPRDDALALTDRVLTLLRPLGDWGE